MKMEDRQSVSRNYRLAEKAPSRLGTTQQLWVPRRQRFIPRLGEHFDRSARRGLAILNRVVAVHATDDSARRSLLHRIRAFFDNPS
jgi:hypothetical protein